jgi:hypothetical protein
MKVARMGRTSGILNNCLVKSTTGQFLFHYRGWLVTAHGERMLNGFQNLLPASIFFLNPADA